MHENKTKEELIKMCADYEITLELLEDMCEAEHFDEKPSELDPLPRNYVDGYYDALCDIYEALIDEKLDDSYRR